MCPGNQDLRSLGGILHIDHVYFYAFCRLKAFCLHLFIFIEERIGLSEVNAVRLSLHSLDYAGHHFLDLAVILIEYGVSFLLADSLEDYVLGIHRRDAAKCP